MRLYAPTDVRWVRAVVTAWRGGGVAQALLDAERSGTTWRDQGLQAAPHFMDSDGSVKVSPCLHTAARPRFVCCACWHEGQMPGRWLYAQ